MYGAGMWVSPMRQKELQEQHAQMRRWLLAIRDHKASEIAYDEFAYKRMVGNYRRAARRGLKGTVGVTDDRGEHESKR